jgi:ATP-binding cassette subfamily C protein
MQNIVKALKLLLFYWKPFKWRIVLLGFLNVFVSFFQGVGILMLIPLLKFVVKNPSDDNNAVVRVFYFIQEYTGVESSLELILILYLGLFIATTMLNYFNSVEQAKFQSVFMMDLRNRLFNKFIMSPWTVLKKQSFSSFSQFLTVEIINVSGFNYSVISMMSSIIVLAIHIGIAFYISAVFSSLLIVAVLVILFITKKAFKKSYSTGKRNFENNNILIKGIENIKSVFKYSKLHNNEDWIAERFQEANGRFAEGVIQVKRISVMSQSILYILGMSLLIGVVYFSLKTEAISHESIFLLIVVFSRIYPKVNALYKQAVNTSSLYTSVSRYHSKIKELERCEVENRERPDEKMVFNSAIKLCDISVGFGDKQLYSDFCLTVNKNSLLGIYGASGSGKTTLLDIIAGLHSDYKGDIYIDDTKLDSDNIKYWKNNISVVPQDTYFIEGSVRENLLFGQVNVGDERIFEALRKCNIYDVVMGLQGGLDSDINNLEYVLSGGEKKRFGLARALLRNADVLLLDEPTSGLDGKTEIVIMDMVKALTNDYTVIIVSHNELLKNYTDCCVTIDSVGLYI